MFRAVILFVVLLLAVPAAGQPGQRNGRPPGPPGPPPPNASQGQGFKWWQAERTRSELGLSADQSTRIEEVFQSISPRLRAAFDDIDRGEKLLSKLISANDTTEVDVVRQLNQLQAAKNEADRQRTLMLFRMQRVLTPEQRVKFKAMRDRWQQERERGRRGTSAPTPPHTQARK